jgi:hypothetical protein
MSTWSFIAVELRSKWEEHHHNWCYIRFPEADESLDVPEATPATLDSWDSLDERDRDLAPIIERIGVLHNRGLTGRHVALDFLRCAIAPLQKRSHAMWAYEGPTDTTRLRSAGTPLEDEVLLKGLLKVLFGGDVSLTFPDAIEPLHRDPMRDEILASMPDCDELGIKATWVRPGHPRTAQLSSASTSRTTIIVDEEEDAPTESADAG